MENNESNFLLLLCHFDFHVLVNALTLGTGYASLFALIRGSSSSVSLSGMVSRKSGVCMRNDSPVCAQQLFDVKIKVLPCNTVLSTQNRRPNAAFSKYQPSRRCQ